VPISFLLVETSVLEMQRTRTTVVSKLAVRSHPPTCHVFS